jgi:hypothetical protein
MTPKERIVELKCIAPKIEFLIEELSEEGDATYYYKRLMQLAKKAKERHQEIATPDMIR